MMKKWTFAWIMLFSFALLVSGCGASEETVEADPVPPPTDAVAAEETPVEEPAGEGEEAEEAREERIQIPDLDMVMLDGSTVQLSDYEGQYVLMTFWATWCTYCKEALPILESVADQYDDVVLLAVDVGEKPEEVKAFAEEAGYGFEIVIDEQGSLAGAFGVTGFPTTYFVHKDRTTFGYAPGVISEEQLKEIIENTKNEPLISEKAPN